MIRTSIQQAIKDSTMESTSPKVQEFQPSVETIHEEDCDTILLYLPGFKKEQLRVQLTRTRNLIISGERKLEQQNKLSHFRKEFPVSTNVETNKISAKFEGSILYIRLPKLITPAGDQPIVLKPPVEPAMPQKPVDEPQPEKKDQQQATESTKPLEQLNERVKQEISSKKEVPNKANGEEIDHKLKSKDSETAPDRVAAKMEKGESSSALGGEKSDITGENGKMVGNTGEKRASYSIDSAKKKYGEAVDGGKKALEKYRQSAGGLATEMKKQRKGMNALVVVLIALVLGIYITNYFKSWKTEETAEL